MKIIIAITGWVAFVVICFFLAMWAGNDWAMYLLLSETENGQNGLVVLAILFSGAAIILTTMQFLAMREDISIKLRPSLSFFAAVAAGLAYGDIVRPFATGEWWTPFLFLWLVGFAPLAVNSFLVASSAIVNDD